MPLPGKHFNNPIMPSLHPILSMLERKMVGLFWPSHGPRLHGLAMVGFVLLSLAFDLQVAIGLIRSGGQHWPTIDAPLAMIAYLICGMAGGLAAVDLALLRRRGLQRLVMLGLGLQLLILVPGVVLTSGLLPDVLVEARAMHNLGLAAFGGALISLLPLLSSNRGQMLDGGDLRPEGTALHRPEDSLWEKITDVGVYVFSGLAGSVLMLLTGLALSSAPASTLAGLLERNPDLGTYLSMTFCNGALCAALGAFAATLRNRKLISETGEKIIMTFPLLLFLLLPLVILPLLWQPLHWLPIAIESLLGNLWATGA